MALPSGRLLHLSSLDNECTVDDYIEGTIASVGLTQYNPSKANAKVAHALITESEVCRVYFPDLMGSTVQCT